MTKAVIGIVAVVIVACLGLPTLLLSSVMSGGSSGCGVAAVTAAGSSGQATGDEQWNTEQLAIAATIIEVGATKGITSRGWTIALAVAMQESRLRNLPHLGDRNDHDSIGVFQQRPSQGWGTAEQLSDPAYQAGKFYDKLLTIPGWEMMPLTRAAQAVQISAYPDAYANWADDATRIVQHVGSGGSWAVPGDLEHCLSNCPTILSRSPEPGLSDSCGTAVLTRAASWLTAWNGGPVPYLSSGDPHSWFQGYRRDCSGYVSMALGLSGPGLDTRGLVARSTPIMKDALRSGDLLINPSPNLRGHVVIFERWTDASMTSYLGYEQSGDGGTHHRIIPYPYFGGYSMDPYRFAAGRDDLAAQSGRVGHRRSGGSRAGGGRGGKVAR